MIKIHFMLNNFLVDSAWPHERFCVCLSYSLLRIQANMFISAEFNTFLTTNERFRWIPIVCFVYFLLEKLRLRRLCVCALELSLMGATPAMTKPMRQWQSLLHLTLAGGERSSRAFLSSGFSFELHPRICLPRLPRYHCVSTVAWRCDLRP